MKTRTAKGKAKTAALPEEAGPQPQPSVDVPPQLFIFPADILPGASIISLIDHANSTPRRYLFCQERGIHEFKRIAAPKKIPKTWLLSRRIGSKKPNESSRIEPSNQEIQDESQLRLQTDETSLEENETLSQGYIMKDAALFLATRIDPVFLLCPVFELDSEKEKRGRSKQFLSADDHLDRVAQSCATMSQLLANTNFKQCLLHRLEAVSQVQFVGDERFFKPDLTRLVDLLVQKAIFAAHEAWSSSLEEEFVSKPFFVPDNSLDLESNPNYPHIGKQSSTSVKASVIDAASQMLTSQTPPSANNELAERGNSQLASVEIIQSLRIRTCLNFMLSSYFPMSLQESLRQIIASNLKLRFAHLDAHLELSEKRRQEVQALRSLSENISRKRALDDDEMAEIHAERKRHKEEEDNKRKAESRALKNLKKADISGMKKLNAFFTKATPKI